MATDLASAVAPSYSTVVAEAVEEGFEFFGERLAAATPAQVSDAILVKLVERIALEQERDRNSRSRRAWPRPTDLPVDGVAAVILRRHRVVNVRETDRAPAAADILAVYVDDERDQAYGLYTVSQASLAALVRRYRPNLRLAEVREVLSLLESAAPRVTRTQDPDLVPMANGIVDYRTGEIQPFSPDYVLLSKSFVNFNPAAENPVIEMPDGRLWDVETWLRELSDDPEVVNLLWEIIGAVLRPYVAWNVAPLFYAESGRNGKGTMMQLLRNLIPSISASMARLGRHFGPVELLGEVVPSAILTDENPVGGFVDSGDTLKALITGDPVSIERKGVDAVTFYWNGVMVQCVNEIPRVRDKSGSFQRRLRFVPFTKQITDSEERAYIKEDYLGRPEVLEYVAKKVLVDMPEYRKLSNPAASRAVLQDFAMENDPVTEFWDEFQHQFVWDLLPTDFLYSLFRAWMAKVNPAKHDMSKARFARQLRQIAVASGAWEAPDGPQRPAARMSGAEPLIAEYGLEDWYNPKANPRTANPSVLSQPALKGSYRGLVRRHPSIGAIDPAKVDAARAARGLDDGEPVTAGFSEIRAAADPSTEEG